jgi:hypothetical protein
VRAVARHIGRLPSVGIGRPFISSVSVASDPLGDRTAQGTIVAMRHLPTILLILSFPVGIVGYTVATDVLQTLTLPAYVRPFVLLFVPLLAAGLVMVPFLVPFIDRKAKADLAAYRASQPPETDDADASPDAAGPPPPGDPP